MVYGGFLTLTYSHLHHFPTMVGFCHSGNMLGGNHHDGDDDDDGDGDYMMVMVMMMVMMRVMV